MSKFREASRKILWFLLGATSVGLLISISTAHGERTTTDLTPRVANLEQRVNAMQAEINAINQRLNKR